MTLSMIKTHDLEGCSPFSKVQKHENPDNIAYMLFLDVEEFYSGSSGFSMRYQNDTKEFWSLGYKMFKDNFLRFMGGEKNSFERNEEALVNFVVPDRKLLQKEIESINIHCGRPGIIEKNIKNFSTVGSHKSYKICFDGKKITPGYGQKLGEVDLFGFESEPTCLQRHQRLECDLSS